MTELAMHGELHDNYIANMVNKRGYKFTVTKTCHQNITYH